MRHSLVLRKELDGSLDCDASNGALLRRYAEQSYGWAATRRGGQKVLEQAIGPTRKILLRARQPERQRTSRTNGGSVAARPDS